MKKLLIGFVVTGCAIVAGYSLSRSSFYPLIPSASPTPSPYCGADGCQAASMKHDIEITDEKVFLMEMIPHHQEAVDTSELVFENTQDLELRKFTYDVLSAQKKEIEQMKGWLKSWYNLDYQTSTTYLPMMGELSQFEGKALDKLYVEGMIRHHQGAIDMAKKLLTLHPRPELKKMADDIITTQQAEVDTLKAWLAAKYEGVNAQDETDHQMNIH